MAELKQPLLPVDSIIFDMDGLLIDSERLAMNALENAGIEMGYDTPLSFCQSMIGVPMDQCRTLASARFGADFPLDAYFQMADKLLAAYVASGRLQLKPGAIELLALLDERGIRKAIATSSSQLKADHHLKHVGIRDRFDAIITRDDVLRGKPDPDPYLRAAKALETPLERCLAIEDSYNGVRAAHAAGIRVVMVPDLLEPTEEMRQKTLMVVTTLHAVVDLLGV